jgi:xylose isomerase
MPVGEQMSMMGWDTDIIPVDKMEVALAKFEKALQGMQAK